MRVEIPGDPISVVYGYDQMTGVFLSVFDKRLEYNEESSAAVNAVTLNIGVKDGGGSYFDLHTGSFGFGPKVDHKTMATFLKRFGVSDEQISALPLDISSISSWMRTEPGTSTRQVGAMKICTNCRNESSTCKDCSACRGVPYCTKDCQKADWPIHKVFCGLKGQVPSTLDDGTAVTAFLFPEKSDTPVFVNLPIVDLVGGEQELDCKEFIDGISSKIRSDFFTDASIRSLPHAYHVFFKDDFGADGSEINSCVLNLFKRYDKKIGYRVNEVVDCHWRNNIIVAKALPGGIKAGSFRDISIADATEVVKFLYRYTSSKGLMQHGH